MPSLQRLVDLLELGPEHPLFTSRGWTLGALLALAALSYDGPCPPTNFAPLAHDYVVTVYALDIELPTLPTFGDFPPGSQALYHALIAVGRDGHILASAHISGFYSAAVPPAGP